MVYWFTIASELFEHSKHNKTKPNMYVPTVMFGWWNRTRPRGKVLIVSWSFYVVYFVLWASIVFLVSTCTLASALLSTVPTSM